MSTLHETHDNTEQHRLMLHDAPTDRRSSTELPTWAGSEVAHKDLEATLPRDGCSRGTYSRISEASDHVGACKWTGQHGCQHVVGSIFISRIERTVAGMRTIYIHYTVISDQTFASYCKRYS